MFSRDEILSYHSFCSLMPGATSTQLICLLAYIRGGTRLSLLTLILWILPASIVMLSLAIFCLNFNLIASSESVFVFFQPMVIAYLIFSIQRTKDYYLDKPSSKWLLLLNISIILILFKHPFILPILFLFNAISYNYIVTRSVYPKFHSYIRRLNINKIHLLSFLTLFFIIAFLSEFSRKSNLTTRYYFNIVEHNYRHGSMVYGGGDILIPMMYEQYVTRPTANVTKRRNPDILSLNKEELLSAAGLIRLVPGPVFTLTAFTTPFLLKNYNTEQQIFASALACLSIFIPGLLIIISFYPLWSQINKNKIFSNYISGINLTVIAIMIATAAYLLFDLIKSHFFQPTLLVIQLVAILLILSLLKFTKISHAVIAFICLLGGISYYLL